VVTLLSSPKLIKSNQKLRKNYANQDLVRDLYDSIYNEQRNEQDFRNIREIDGSFSSLDEPEPEPEQPLQNGTHNNKKTKKLNEKTFLNQQNNGLYYDNTNIEEDISPNLILNDEDNNFIKSESESETTEIGVKESLNADMNKVNEMLNLLKNKNIKKPPPTKQNRIYELIKSPKLILEAEIEAEDLLSLKNNINLAPKLEPSQKFKPKVRQHLSKEDSIFEETEEDEMLPINLVENWLLKWCILKENRTKLCQKAFELHDTNKKGYLVLSELVKAIGSIVNLNNFKFNYLISVLKLCEIQSVVDVKVFNILTALAFRINYLDDKWFKNVMPQLDLSTIENKMFKVRNLWNFLVDRQTKTINMRDLLIEFEAGGVTHQHVEYAREKFRDKQYFDLLDYLTYIPLFVYIHDRVVDNPFDKNRDI
jgi:hypothetical protein